MELTNTINLCEIVNRTDVLQLNERLSKLTETNLSLIKQVNDMTFIVPVSRQMILLLYLGYKFKVPIVKGAALYQMYANDLLVIMITLLEQKYDLDTISECCSKIYQKLTTKELVNLPKEYQEFYTLLTHCLYEGKLYIPPTLW